MELIAQRPIALGSGPVIQPGQAFNVPDRAIADKFIESGRARYGSIEQKPLPIHEHTGLVSCIMPTRDRRRFVPRAVKCFLDQTYEKRELIVLDNGSDSVADLMPVDPRIRYVKLKTDPLIGKIRNFCCQIARGEFIAHWDDDDWSHHRRIEEQVAAIGDRKMTAYRSMLFDGPNGVYLYDCDAPHAVGTSLLYRRAHWEVKPFQPLRQGEDSGMVESAKSSIVILPGVGRMVSSNHDTNTSPRKPRVQGKDHPRSFWFDRGNLEFPEGYTAI